MELNITLQEEKIFVSFADHVLEVSETSSTWNMAEINKFLINLASKTPDQTPIRIKKDEALVQAHKVYAHIVFLFEEFAKSYNQELEQQHSNN